MAPNPTEFKGTLSIGGGKVGIYLRLERLNVSRHRFEEINDKKGGFIGTRIDGLDAVGIDGIPKGQEAARLTGLTSFRVQWHGRDVPIPAEKFRFVLNPSLVPSEYSGDDGSVLLLPGRDNRSVLIRLSGSDGAATYKIWWAIHKSGEVTIFTEGAP